MTSTPFSEGTCPPTDALAALLSDDDEPETLQPILEHLALCLRCRQRLSELAVDDDWPEMEAILASDEQIWSAVSAPATSDDPTVALPPLAEASTGGLDPMAETVAYQSGKQNETTPPTPRQPLGEFAEYELIDKLGAGGMGIVYSARQKSADRIVALKIIRPEKIALLEPDRRQTWLDRFRSEAQAAARLEHDHVVRVYDVGEHDGTMFYSMQFIEGQSLAELVRERPLENRRVARLMHGVATAVAHAHQLGVLHRDLKPHNILVRQISGSILAGSKSETFAARMDPGDSHSERSYVADFGLAKNFEEEQSGSTHTGEVLGSPSYMSPEQASDTSRCTPLSDVYSIGATMYDALTGRPPFRAASPIETLRQVIDQPPVEPRDLNPAIDLDLQTITLKALEKDPARRYSSATAMADDLHRYLEGVPIEARPIGRFERGVRWCRRNPAVAALAGGVAGLLMLIALGSTIASGRLSRQAEREMQARQEAEDYFVMSLDVIDEMLAEFGDESLAHVPQMERVRKQLLEKALGLYAELSASRPTSPELRIELARTQHRVAMLYDLLGQPDQARTAFEAAIVLFEALIVESPADPLRRFYLASSHAMLGETLRKTSPAEAESHLETAIGSLQSLHLADPLELKIHRELSQTLNNLGLLFSETGDYAAAQKRLGSAIDHLRRLVERDQVESQTRAGLLADLGRSEINLGVLLRKSSDDREQSESCYRDAIAHLQQAKRLDADNRDYRFRHAVASIDLANAYLSDGTQQGDAAQQLAQNAVDEFGRLTDEYPGIPLYQYEQANAFNTLAVAFASESRFNRSGEAYEQANILLDRLSGEFPRFADSEARFHSLRGRVFGGQSFLTSRGGNLRRAIELAEQAMACQQSAVELHPDDPQFAEYLSRHRDFCEALRKQLDEQE